MVQSMEGSMGQCRSIRCLNTEAVFFMYGKSFGPQQQHADLRRFVRCNSDEGGRGGISLPHFSEFISHFEICYHLQARQLYSWVCTAGCLVLKAKGFRHKPQPLHSTALR